MGESDHFYHIVLSQFSFPLKALKSFLLHVATSMESSWEAIQGKKAEEREKREQEEEEREQGEEGRFQRGLDMPKRTDRKTK